MLQVLATNGDTHLGGEDFDQRVMQYLIKVHHKKIGVDIKDDTRAMQKLRREVPCIQFTVFLKRTQKSVYQYNVGRRLTCMHILQAMSKSTLPIGLFRSFTNLEYITA